MDGYILKARRPTYLPVDERVRCALTFEPDPADERPLGFAAFRDLERWEAIELARLSGGTLAENAPLPGLPVPFDPSNPDSIKGLKNRVCRAKTVIAAYVGWSDERWKHLQTWPGVMGASWTDLFLLLVEFGADEGWPVVYPGEAWAGYVAEVRDIRSLVTV